MFGIKDVSAAPVCMAVLVALALGVARPLSAQSGLVFVVTSTADNGDTQPGDGVCATGAGGCTLRAAIQEANAVAGHDTIQFAVGSGVQTIDTQSNLPAVTSPVTIDGTTQPGFSGSPLIVVNGGGRYGGFKIASGGSTLRGLAITRFAGDGVELSGDGNVLETNYVGLAADGTTAAANSGSGVVILNSSGNRIGGTSVSQRNVISGNTGKGNGGGIYISGGSGHVVQGNFIGTDATGMLERANEGRGIALSGTTNNTIGGPAPGAGNLISGNRATATRLIGSHGNVIQGNYMGMNRTLTAIIANDRGVQLRDSNDNQVLGNLLVGHTYDGVLIWGGSNNTLQGNVIAFNGRGPVGDPVEAGFAGVWISTGTGNRLLGNSIFGNAMLGIALGIWSPVANDAGDGDAGANNLQNYPRLTAVTQSGATTRISGVLNSSASTSYLVQAFADPECDSTGFGEGRYFIAQASLTTDASGHISFTWSLPFAVPRGWFVTSTATDPAGNTSAFSACAVVQ